MSAENREKLVQRIRHKWEGSHWIPAYRRFIEVPPVRDGGTTAAIIDLAVAEAEAFYGDKS